MLIAGQCTLLRPGRPPGEAAHAASATFSILINEHTKPKPQRCVQLSVGNPFKVNMAAITAAVAALRCWLGVYGVYPVKNRKNNNDKKCSTAQFNTCHSPAANTASCLAHRWMHKQKAIVIFTMASHRLLAPFRGRATSIARNAAPAVNGLEVDQVTSCGVISKPLLMSL